MNKAAAKVYVIGHSADECESFNDLLRSRGLEFAYFLTGTEFFENWDGELLGCILMDLSPDGMSACDILLRLRDSSRVLPVILFTSSLDMRLAIDAAKLGVFDYSSTSTSPEQLLEKIENALKVNRERLDTYGDHLNTIKALREFTDREMVVLDHLCDGKTSKQIAKDLGISPHTVNNHRARVLGKLGASSVSQVVQMILKARR